jgi:ParB family transcriptional regulator, chromosome partitioning protein
METKTNQSTHSELRLVPVSEITADPSQPRQTFNEEKMRELVESVRAKGVLQSLLLRPNPKGGFLLISGERRLRAAKIVGLAEVPASIRELSDEEAKEMQLIENLHREDVHEMEQAKCFLSLIEEGKMDHLEIANHIGKSIYFVRQHLKLNSLIAGWQKMFLKDAITLTTALQICTLPDDLQKDFYASTVSKEDEKSDKPILSINDYMLKRYKGNLARACFDLNDSELDKKMGACSTCSFNSANSSLFPEEQQNPQCSNAICFKNKTELHFNNALTKAKEDPSILLIYDGYSIPDIVKKLKSERTEVLREGYGDDCKIVETPDKPIWEAFHKVMKRKKLSEKKIKEEFKAEEERYNSAIVNYEQKLAVGKYKKAFMVYSNGENQVGHYFFVELIPKASGKILKKKIDEQTDHVEDIDNEIKRIQQRQARAKELDQEKIHRKIVEAVKTDTAINAIPKKVLQMDTAFVNFLICEYLSYNNREDVQKVIKSSALWNPKDIHQFKNALQSLSKFQISYLVRKIITDKYITNLPNNTGGFIFRLMAESLNTIPIPDFENEQMEVAKKRQSGVDKSIAVLKELKKELSVKNRTKANQKSIGQKSDKRGA